MKKQPLSSCSPLWSPPVPTGSFRAVACRFPPCLWLGGLVQSQQHIAFPSHLCRHRFGVFWGLLGFLFCFVFCWDFCVCVFCGISSSVHPWLETLSKGKRQGPLPRWEKRQCLETASSPVPSREQRRASPSGTAPALLLLPWVAKN